MNLYTIKIKVNNKLYELTVPANKLLAEVVREDLGLTGTKLGCSSGECGSCTVILNGKSVLSCLILAADCDGAEILTIEGLSKESGSLDPIQEAFANNGAVQCGFCTPGMILSAKFLLDRNPNPSDNEIKKGLNGNICRCTGYLKIFTAVKEAAKKLSEK